MCYNNNIRHQHYNLHVCTPCKQYSRMALLSENIVTNNDYCLNSQDKKNGTRMSRDVPLPELQKTSHDVLSKRFPVMRRTRV